MAAKKKSGTKKSSQASLGEDVADYRHDEKRKNNPPAGLVEFDRPPAKAKKEYAYDPHLDPQLVWAGKAEHTSFEVDTVSLHIHERISTQAILRAVKREEQEPQLNLFAKPELPSSKEVDFYGHEVGWANRMILGDSLTVMNSLLERENMAGQVQCIYMDPPYGVKFNSNFQPSISRRDVKDGDDGSLTREPEQIQAYRDTWELGIHSYLGYLRDRLFVARELLTTSGSVFVQISNENLHLVRAVADEVFGASNACGLITFAKTTGAGSPSGGTVLLPQTSDYLLWYARDIATVKFRQLFLPKAAGGAGASQYEWIDTGRERRRASASELADPRARIFAHDNMTSQSKRSAIPPGSAREFAVRARARRASGAARMVGPPRSALGVAQRGGGRGLAPLVGQ